MDVPDFTLPGELERMLELARLLVLVLELWLTLNVLMAEVELAQTLPQAVPWQMTQQALIAAMVVEAAVVGTDANEGVLAVGKWSCCEVTGVAVKVSSCW